MQDAQTGPQGHAVPIAVNWPIGRPNGSIRTVAIVGAGVMGRGIAAACLSAGHSVILLDANETAARAAARSFATRAVSEFPHRPHFLRRSTASITVARSVGGLARADLVIESVPEDRALKSAVLSELEPRLRAEAIVASNTSSIPIAALASGMKDSSRLCGLHFCHPVAERRLVEVVGAESTSPQTLAAAFRFAASLGKNPIIVRDGPGFLLNRIVAPYLSESLELLLEGASAELLDEVAREFGLPWGPLRQLDEFGLDVALAVGGTLWRAAPDRFPPSELLIALYKDGRLGRKSGGGFSAADDPDGRRLDPHVVEVIRRRSRGMRCVTREEAACRMFVPMLLEATRALEESLVANAEIVDAALRDGLGMTSVYRGLFAWANRIGPAVLVEWLGANRALGPRFQPTRTLLAAAARRTDIGAVDGNAVCGSMPVDGTR